MSFILAPILAQALNFSFGDRTEVDMRFMDATRYNDAYTAPWVRLNLDSPRTAWALTYSPRFSWLRLGTDSPSRVTTHTGNLTSRLQLTRRTSLSFSEMGSYGTQNFRLVSFASPDTQGTNDTTDPNAPPVTPPVTPTATGVDTAPLASQLKFGSFSTTAALSERFSRNLLGTVSVGYSIGGGIGLASRRLLPYNRRTTASAESYYVASAKDGLRASVSGDKNEVSVNTTYFTTFEAGWTHRLARPVTMNIGLGLVYWTWAEGSRISRLGVTPSAAATIAYEKGTTQRRVSASLTETLSPTVDRVLGTVNQRFTTMGLASFTDDPLTLSLSTYVALTDNSMARSSRYIIGGVQSLDYRITRELSAEVGVQETFIGFDATTTMSKTWQTYLALIYTSRPNRL